MSASHDELRDLVLVYEELTETERARADEHLASCSACAELLGRLQRLERAAAAQGAIPPLDAPVLERLSAGEREDADASLALLRTRLRLGPRFGNRPTRAGLRARGGVLDAFRDWLFGPTGMRWALASASVAAILLVTFVVWQPRQSGMTTGALVRDARLAPYSGPRGATVPGWHTGQAFVLDFMLAAPASPVVFHVDPRGSVTLLYPESPTSPAPIEPAGLVRLPREGSEIVWRLEGEPGPETFLVGATANGQVSLRELAAEAERAGGSDRDAALGRLRALLERRLGPVQSIEVEHLP